MRSIRTKIEISLLIGAIAIILSVQGSVIVKKALRCEQYRKNDCKVDPALCETKTIECDDSDPDKPMHCFTVWDHDNVTGHTEVNFKGCFSNSDQCDRPKCINNDAAPKKNVFFCCCTVDLCNSDYQWLPIIPSIPQEVEVINEEPTSQTLTIFISTVSVLIIFVGVFALLYLKKRKQSAFNEVPTMEPESTGSTLCLTNLQATLIRSIARGRFGTVWQATLPESTEVAVKIFLMQEKQSWITEQEVFKLPGMNHPNILKFIGAEKHTDKIQAEFWLVTAYHNHGSLCDYLKAHTVTWPELCKIAESMARGLMHLHDEIPATKYGQLKPAIAHRDFKSKNVLLKHDLTACIADFGLALVFEPGKPCGDTHGQVGTRRYMAPEVLEGAINFTRDAFLRIDVYACGLVLWELVSRCSAHSGNIPEYSLPFESELGSHPTLDEMQENVVMKKMRPVISNQWRSNPQLSSICDTIEECWDHDAEARLSASCIKERVAQMNRLHQNTTTLLIESNTPVIENCE